MSDQSTNLPSTPPAFGAPTVAAGGRRAVPWLRILAGVVIAAVALALPYYNDPATNQIFCQVMYLALAAMGLNLLTGFNGQISLGHGAFFGIGHRSRLGPFEPSPAVLRDGSPVRPAQRAGRP